jgi:hypothetical protein
MFTGRWVRWRLAGAALMLFAGPLSKPAAPPPVTTLQNPLPFRLARPRFHVTHSHADSWALACRPHSLCGSLCT